MAVIVVLMSLWGVSLDLGRVDPQYQFFAQADEEAMKWIRTNTPTTARFIVNSFPAYDGSVVAGTDGGWWIPLLTGRQTNLPPINYGIEQAMHEGYGLQVNAFAATIRGRALENAAPVRVDLTTYPALQVLRDARIGYVYSGARQRPGPDQADRIDVAALQASASFRRVYALGGVEIFQLVDGD
jgi:asparagine N-glycosylation enzyme membrane subunit Stt3